MVRYDHVREAYAVGIRVDTPVASPHKFFPQSPGQDKDNKVLVQLSRSGFKRPRIDGRHQVELESRQLRLQPRGPNDRARTTQRMALVAPALDSIIHAREKEGWLSRSVGPHKPAQRARQRRQLPADTAESGCQVIALNGLEPAR